MTVSKWTEGDSNRAKEIWSEYQQRHDLSDKVGQTAGIDPASGRVWFGDSIQDVIAQRDAAGSAVPLFFMRVGSPTYYRKGGHRLHIDFPRRPSPSIKLKDLLERVPEKSEGEKAA